MSEDHKECTVLILWKNKSWEERSVKAIMPKGSSENDLAEHAVRATMSNLAAVGKLDDVHTMGVTKGFVEVARKEPQEEEKKEEDASTH